MELAGDEKRIQALFSELSFQDQSCTPRFEILWTEAKNAGPAPVRTFTPAIAIAAGLIIAAASLFGAWSWYRSIRSPAQQVVRVEPPTNSTSPVQEVNNRTTGGTRSNHHQRHRRLARLRQTDRAVMREATLLASWQSPTQRYIESPTTSVFNSLPQLNQSAEELKLFLPKNNELTKESNQ